MRKTLIAAAVLGTLAAPAALANDHGSSVTIYGRVNYGVTVHDDGVVTQAKVDNLQSGSRLGFQGEEKLDNGMKAWFQIETSLGLDTATATSLGSREGWVGLAGDFGKLGLGRGKTPFTNVIDVFDTFTSPYHNFVMTSRDGGIASRFNNSVRWDSPKWGSADAGTFTVATMYGFGENKSNAPGQSETKNLSFNARYAAKNFGVDFGYSDENDAAGVDGADNNAWLLAGNIKMDAFRFLLGYGRTDRDTVTTVAGRATLTTSKRDTIIGQVRYAAGNNNVWAGLMHGSEIERNGRDVADSDYTRYSVGYGYNLSKRTQLVAELAGDRNSGAAEDTNSFLVGVMHSF